MRSAEPLTVVDPHLTDDIIRRVLLRPVSGASAVLAAMPGSRVRPTF
jgi:hypothetical protein